MGEDWQPWSGGDPALDDRLIEVEFVDGGRGRGAMAYWRLLYVGGRGEIARYLVLDF